jgi:cytoskeletal protein RodZ
VYRRRRLVLVLLIAVIAAVVWLLIAQPWRGAAAVRASATPTSSPSSTVEPGSPSDAMPTPTPTVPSPTPTPTAEPTPTADASPTASATPVVEACTAGDVRVEGVTDHDTYAADQNPQFSITLTNQGSTDCSLNVGTSAQVFTVTSGSDTWWRSTDCQSEPSDMVVTLTAGQTVTSATPLTWDRTRSAVDSCDGADRPRAVGGGATYHLAVSIGGVPATQTAMFMLE